jgi:high affinity sulfate transporter 1
VSSGNPVNPFGHSMKPRGIARWIPGIAVLRSYTVEWLLKDALAGLALAAVLVPVGMSYAQAAGLPAITGLYATIGPLIAYAIFGPSRILVLGPDSALAALIAASILPLAAGDPERAVGLAGLLAILSGALCILAGIARFGFITDLISKPIRYGYLNGIALTVMVGQLPKLLGFSVNGNNFLQEARGLALGINEGRINWTACAIGLSCLTIIFASKRWAPRLPGVLLAVIGATTAVVLLDLAARTGINVVGPLPQGLPIPTMPAVSLDDLRALLGGAIAVALVAFADMSMLSRTYALRNKESVDSNQELIALGVANIASGLLRGFSVSSSASRTPVAEAAGAKTQVTGVIGALAVALLLIGAPSLLKDLPTSALGAVVISACVALVEVRGLVRLYHLRTSEFLLSITCFLGVALLGVIPGIFLAVGLALLAFVWRAWRPYDAVLGRVDGMKGYHDVSRHPEARRIPGLVLFRWDAPLFFANAEIFREHVLRAVADAPTPTKWVVVAAEPVTDIDLTAADAVSDLDRELHEVGMDLCFAEVKGPVKDLLKRYGLFATLGTENFFPTIGEAVDGYLAVHKVEWRDWED